MKAAAELFELIGLALLLCGAYVIHPGLAIALVGIVLLAATAALNKR